MGLDGDFGYPGGPSAVTMPFACDPYISVLLGSQLGYSSMTPKLFPLLSAAGTFKKDEFGAYAWSLAVSCLSSGSFSSETMT